MLDFNRLGSSMARPISRIQALENRAFLKILRRTGNIRLSSREAGLNYSTMQTRRDKHPAFAARWAAALAAAQARLGQVGTVGPAAGRPLCSPLRAARYKTSKTESRHGSESRDVDRARCATRRPVLNISSTEAQLCSAKPPLRSVFRTAGGELVICRRNDGKLQMRRAQPGKLTREAEQHFLGTLATTCNVRLAAAAVDAAGEAFARRRRRRPGFDQAVHAAIEEGYDHLEAEMVRSAIALLRGGGAGDAGAGPAVTGMTAQVALSLLGHHRKTARLPEQYRPYDVDEVRQRLEAKMRMLGLLDRPDSAGAGEGVV